SRFDYILKRPAKIAQTVTGPVCSSLSARSSSFGGGIVFDFLVYAHLRLRDGVLPGKPSLSCAARNDSYSSLRLSIFVTWREITSYAIFHAKHPSASATGRYQ